MELTVTENKPDSLSFTLRSAESAFANALRRIILSEVPTLAINEVTVRSNSSVTQDEMLVHRLGLVPIVSTEAAEMNFPWACPCKDGGRGCSRCTVEMELVVRCARDEPIRQITTRDISVISGPLASKVFPASCAIWLTSLGPGQDISLYCKVQKGIAKQHAKWMPASAVTMQYEANITLDGGALSKLSTEERDNFIAVCPKSVFALNPTNKTVFVKNPEKCIFCNNCVTPENLPSNMATVKPKKTSHDRFTYRFQIETVGSLSPQEVLRNALEILRSKLSVVEKYLQGKESLSYTQGYHLAGLPLVQGVHEKEGEAQTSTFAETEVMSA
ncbi:DNA-directed RNA polymerase I-like protein [Perkinsela sp. CCAP 1560/4]|nr:DNA-directed RNA polymerase I-like protein [Perkinsela sp. CCAP 1560/4]|eukprot:KNH07615.1 DNA-directed RNA polymerase I-like protein [Perkinsela sp. CCAP 1560/4]